MIKRGLGWKPDDPADHARDYRFGLSRPVAGLPARFDFADWMPPIQDQRETNACVSYSLAAFIQALDRANTSVDDDWFPSPLYIYYNVRNLENTIDDDDGCQIRNAIKTVQQFGACSNDVWPETRPLNRKPNPQCYENARFGMIGRYSRVAQNLDNIRACLAQRRPVLFGFKVYPQFLSDHMEKTGVLEMPKGETVGRHAVLAVGYDDRSRYFGVRNHYGTKWGLPSVPGHFVMPYAYMENPELVSDLWTIQSPGELVA